MAANRVLTIDELLIPIEGASPSGLPLRGTPATDGVYRRLKDARAKARMVERKRAERDPDHLDKQPDWAPVLNEIPEILKTQSKDLELAAWFAEGLVREHGFAGLRDGLQLLREMCERFWESVHPIPDEEGLAVRVAPLIGLSGDETDGTLVQPIANAPITRPRDGQPYSEATFREAGKLETLDEESRQRRIAAGATTMAQVQSSADQSPPEFFRDLLDDLAACREECLKIDSLLATRYAEANAASNPPTLANISRQLERVHEAAQSIGAAKAAAANPEAAVDDATPATGAKDGPATGTGRTIAQTSRGPVANREAAFEQIMQVAEYFRRTEPQSIIPSALEQVVRWGRMPLPELLAEFVPEVGARNRFGWLGIVPKGEQAQPVENAG